MMSSFPFQTTHKTRFKHSVPPPEQEPILAGEEPCNSRNFATDAALWTTLWPLWALPINAADSPVVQVDHLWKKNTSQQTYWWNLWQAALPSWLRRCRT